ncbi:hypothetical protein [Paraflavitalea speifideaquila]|uniref:hypothetical protein n=1 Tax=Paraflavitalea speifideaquila TaxID=3076558 RepID=UPI0028EAFB0B|nr:hypothetical protein [Paraflavitalea speifideiaquila]
MTPFANYRPTGGVGLPDQCVPPAVQWQYQQHGHNIRMFEAQNHVPIFYNYRYDQLNRLVKGRTITSTLT